MGDGRGTVVVTGTLELQVVQPWSERGVVRADLRFDPADPYAVTLLLHDDVVEHRSVRWSFARELLIDGLYRPTGQGDVHVWPYLGRDGHAAVVLELSSPTGALMLQAESRVLAVFVAAMTVSVPPGDEGSFVDVDDLLARVLDG